MLRDITLGQYYPSDSVIHKMDPRVKLFGTIVFIISLFLFQKISVYVVATLFLAAVIMISKVPFSFMVKGLKGIFVLMMITVVFNLFLTPGTTAFAIWKLSYLGRYPAGCFYGCAPDLSDPWIFSADADYDTE